ncbi:rab-GTPase-TBC domain-containing protein [Cunninghamella echinulata]|nr:rab-GTPase-TBC domain-containing protein [Cunninghamella echinulata]
MTKKRKSQLKYRRPRTAKINEPLLSEKPKYHIENEEEIRQDILTAIKEKNIDQLRQIGKDHGFIHNNLRRKAWPLLLHCTLTNKITKRTSYKSKKHKDEEQVFLDIKRSFNTFPKNLDEKRKKVLQQELNQVIVQVLRNFPKLHYYQGFHDICAVFLLLFGQSNAIQLLSHVALFYLRDAMLDSLDPILKEIELLNTLYKLKDEKLYEHFQSMGILPYYCLSWIITWFSHDLEELEDIYRIFDLILSTHPMMPLYITASLVILNYKPEEINDQDPSILHHYLCKLPYQSNLKWKPILQHAIQLYTTYPPFELQQHANVGLSQVSSLNTYHQHYLFCSSIIQDRTKSDTNDDDAMMFLENKVEKWIEQASDILIMSPLERDQSIDISVKHSNKLALLTSRTNGMPVWMMIGAVGLGTVAVILSASQSPSQLLSRVLYIISINQ